MIYVITQNCEIANKAYKPGDQIEEKDTAFFASVMKKVDSVGPVGPAKVKAEAKPADKPMTKKEMVEVINGITPLSEDQKKELMGKNVPDLTAEMEKVKAEAKPAE